MKDFFRLLRVRQWIKNVFILVPLIFSGKFQDPALWGVCLWVLAGFSLVASATYIVNDILDHKQDRVHPQKSRRPISAGRVPIPAAWIISLVCLAAGMTGLFFIDPRLALLGLVYVLLQVVYNVVTKHHVILDVLTVAFGFQVRIWIGALAVGVMPSLWLQMCVLVLALFLGFTKRRYEMVELKEKAVEHRGAFNEYTVHFLDQMIIISSTLAIVFYGLYTISGEVTSRIGGNELLYSICFVIYGMFRYLYLLHVKKLGDDPGEVLLADMPLLVTVLLWGGFVTAVIFMSKGF